MAPLPAPGRPRGRRRSVTDHLTRCQAPPTRGCARRTTGGRVVVAHRRPGQSRRARPGQARPLQVASNVVLHQQITEHLPAESLEEWMADTRMDRPRGCHRPHRATRSAGPADHLPAAFNAPPGRASPADQEAPLLVVTIAGPTGTGPAGHSLQRRRATDDESTPHIEVTRPPVQPETPLRGRWTRDAVLSPTAATRPPVTTRGGRVRDQPDCCRASPTVPSVLGAGVPPRSPRRRDSRYRLEWAPVACPSRATRHPDREPPSAPGEPGLRPLRRHQRRTRPGTRHVDGIMTGSTIFRGSPGLADPRPPTAPWSASSAVATPPSPTYGGPKYLNTQDHRGLHQGRPRASGSPSSGTPPAGARVVLVEGPRWTPSPSRSQRPRPGRRCRTVGYRPHLTPGGTARAVAVAEPDPGGGRHGRRRGRPAAPPRAPTSRSRPRRRPAVSALPDGHDPASSP